MSVYQSRLPASVVSRLRMAAGLVGIAGALLIIQVASTHGALGEEAKADSPTWQGVLSVQLKDEYRCDLDKVLFEHDVEAGGRVSKEGRVRCLDGREFDFSRPSTHEKFDIRLCQPTVC
ncbi:MAG: hypothetical protein AB7U75_11405 [Hyphomicrobiaceae bacterium]